VALTNRERQQLFEDLQAVFARYTREGQSLRTLMLIDDGERTLAAGNICERCAIDRLGANPELTHAPDCPVTLGWRINGE